jgi:hypothetical protein
MVQTPSFGIWQPIENSPPGIQTIPAGAFLGAGAEFGMVAANGEALVLVSDASVAHAGFATQRLIAMAPNNEKIIRLGFIR